MVTSMLTMEKNSATKTEQGTPLRDCPCCGSKAKMLRWRLRYEPHYQYGQVMCASCGLRSPEWGDIRQEGGRWETRNEEDVVEKWNKRVVFTTHLKDAT